MWDAPWHWVIVAIIVIALFGYKKLPDAARSVGRSLRIFKTEIKGMTEDDKARAEAHDTGSRPALAAPPAEVVERRVVPDDGASGIVDRPRPAPRPGATASAVDPSRVR